MHVVAFAMFASVTLFSGLMVVLNRNPVYSVLYLILSFFGSAGLFILLNSEFIAMVMIIVYVGAIAVLFLFVVMMLDLQTEPKRKGALYQSFSVWIFFAWRFVGYSVVFFVFMSLFFQLNPQALFILLSPMESFRSLGFGGVFHLIYLSIFFPFSVYATTLIFGYRPKELLVKTFRPLFSQLTSLVLFVSALFSGFLSWNFSPAAVQVHLRDSPQSDPLNNTEALAHLLYEDSFIAFQGAGLILLVAMIASIVLTQRTRKNVKRQNVYDQVHRKREDAIEVKNLKFKEGIS